MSIGFNPGTTFRSLEDRICISFISSLLLSPPPQIYYISKHDPSDFPYSFHVIPIAKIQGKDGKIILLIDKPLSYESCVLKLCVVNEEKTKLPQNYYGHSRLVLTPSLE